jgi:hypothetical protein
MPNAALNFRKHRLTSLAGVEAGRSFPGHLSGRVAPLQIVLPVGAATVVRPPKNLRSELLDEPARPFPPLLRWSWSAKMKPCWLKVFARLVKFSAA